MNRAREWFARIGNGRGFMPRQMLLLLPITSKSPAKRRARASPRAAFDFSCATLLRYAGCRLGGDFFARLDAVEAGFVAGFAFGVVRGVGFAGLGALFAGFNAHFCQYGREARILRG